MSKSMDWESIKNHLQGNNTDLIEAYFLDLNIDSWRKLFQWASNKIVILDCQYGRLESEEFNFESFIEGSMSYIAHVKSENGFELSLSIIEENELLIDVEIVEVNTEEQFRDFMNCVSSLAQVIGCREYIICEEFKKESPFLVNGIEK